MAKSTDYANKLKGFADRVKTEPVQLPVQRVTPVEAAEPSTARPSAARSEEQQLNVWIPKDLMKRLKVKGAETDQSLKDMVIEALNQFL